MDGERHAEPLAQLAAEALVAVGVVAQPVVDVQGAHRVGPGDPHGEVEQADGVAPAGEQHHHRPPCAQEPVGADAGLEVHQWSFSAWRARNSSVDPLKPLRLTSPMRSNSRWPPAASTTGRVTSTSPPAARAPTRAARLTARPK